MAPLNRINNIHHSIQRRSMSNEAGIEAFDVKYKVLLLGDTLVGKTSLQRLAAGRDFRPDIGSTIGVDFVNKIIPIEKANVNLQIWDTAGQKNFRTINKSYYASTRAFILVYDVTNPETFQLIEQLSRFIEHAKLDIERRYLVANKIDLIEERIVDEDDGRRFAMRNSMTYFETSCKTRENVSELFEQIASDLVRQHDPNLLGSHRPVRDNFAFNYQTPSSSTDPLHNNSRPTANSSLIKKNQGFSLQCLFCCCPRKRTAI